MPKKILYLTLSIVIGACSTPAKYGTVLDITKTEFKQDLNAEKLRQVIAKIPNSIVNILTPKVNNMELAESNANNQIEKKFNVIADNAVAKSFFLELVDGTPFNIVVHPEVQGTISLSLKNVTINDVLEAVQKIYGYGFEYSPQSVRIFPVSLQTKVFKLNYLDLVRVGNSSTSVSSASATFSTTGNSGGGSSSSGGATTSTNNASSNSNNSNSSGNNNSLDTITSKISTTSNTDLWEQLLKSLQSMIGADVNKTGDSKSNGKGVAINKMAGMIVVTAYPNELQKVEQFLVDTERTLNRQVMLEAKVLEVDLNDGYRSGINWALLNDNLQASQIGIDLNNEADISASTPITDVKAGNTNNVDLSSGLKHLAPKLPATAVTSFGGLLSLGINYRKLATFVELLSAQGNVQVLSSPRITTSNNQKALIKVGSDSYFITNISTSTTTAVGTTAGQSNSSTSTPTVTLNPFFSGIALDVTPQIGEDDITLHIHPTISTVAQDPQQIPGLGANGGTGSVNLAKSTVRESDSIVRAKNGQLIVIGGLMQDKTAELITGVPFLKDIPFVGTVFRHTRQHATKSELVILLRPIILDDYKIKTQLQNSYQRLNQLDQGFHVGGNVKWYGNLGESQ